jgi:hypothetical protein
VSPSDITVLRALSGTGIVTDFVGVTTEAHTGTAATLANCTATNCLLQNNTNEVGTVDPPGEDDEFPRWDYVNAVALADAGNVNGGGANFANAADPELTTSPAHFVHLFTTGTVSGQITAGGVGVTTGVRVTITRCLVATTRGIVSPPAGFATGCDTKHGSPSVHIQNYDTDDGTGGTTAGAYTFSCLLEGLYQIDVVPAVGGYTNNEGPDGVVTNGDEVIMLAIQGNGDIETVPAYEVN